MNKAIEWELKKRQVRERDSHTCQKCFKKWEKGKKFDTHHLIEDHEGTQINDPIEYLITLCKSCHPGISPNRKKGHQEYFKNKKEEPPMTNKEMKSYLVNLLFSCLSRKELKKLKEVGYQFLESLNKLT